MPMRDAPCVYPLIYYLLLHLRAPALEEQEVFRVEDLRVLRELPAFSKCFTAVTAEKIAAALAAEAAAVEARKFEDAPMYATLARHLHSTPLQVP